MGPEAVLINLNGEKIKTSFVYQRAGHNLTPTECVHNSNNNKRNNFLKSITSLLYILKFTGLLPFYKIISAYELGPPNMLRRIYTFIAHTIVHSMTIYNFFNLFSDSSTQLFYSYRETDNINYWIEILLCIVTYTTTVCSCSNNSKTFLKILNDVLKFDKEISRQCSADIVNNCGFAIKFIILIVLFQWYIIILKIMGIHEQLAVASYILIGFYSIQSALSSIFVVYASVQLHIITIRFAYLNAILEGYTYREQQGKIRQGVQHFDNIPNRLGNKLSETPHIENFSDESLFAFRMYNKLLKLFKIINESCSVILVIYMGYSFYSITTTTYNLFIQITMQRDMLSSNVLQTCFAVLFLNTAMLALLSRCAGQATCQANETSQIVARVYVKCKNNQNIIDKFLTKSIKQQICFTGYGFFVIDNSTLFKIFSAVTTYLVILIQFKQLEDSKSENTNTYIAATTPEPNAAT